MCILYSKNVLRNVFKKILRNIFKSILQKVFIQRIKKRIDNDIAKWYLLIQKIKKGVLLWTICKKND